jgi:predicted nucleic-acid-binding protein
MIGLDTNVLVRYFAQDDPSQSRRASETIERRLTEDNPGFVSLVTMAELVWVLAGVYSMSDGEVAAAVTLMLQADTFVVQNEQQVFIASTALTAGTGSFADALIGALGLWGGCSRTLTFDKRAQRLGGFELI